MPTTTKNKKLTKAQRRVAIAKDVLKWIPKSNIRRGSYITGSLPSELTPKPKEQLQKYIRDMTSRCSVCALGACMLSHVRLFDKLTVGEFGAIEGNVVDAMRCDTTAVLSEVFEREQLAMIECAFEGYDHSCALNWKDARECESFAANVSDSKDKLRMIMKNIIKNDGAFVPVAS